MDNIVSQWRQVYQGLKKKVSGLLELDDGPKATSRCEAVWTTCNDSEHKINIAYMTHPEYKIQLLNIREKIQILKDRVE